MRVAISKCNKGIVNYLARNIYGVHSSRSTDDVLTVITHKINKVLDSSLITRVITLDFSRYSIGSYCTNSSAMTSLEEFTQSSRPFSHEGCEWTVF